MWSKKGRSDPHVPITGLISHTDMVSPPPPCRLKSLGGNKTVEALLALGCSRRVLLTGTPVQNNLDEFYGEAVRGSGKGLPWRGWGNRERLA